MIGGVRRSLGSELSSSRPTPKWSRSGSGEGFRYGRTGLFNSSLDGNTRRAIDFHEGDKIDEKALKALIRAAVALNTWCELPPAPSALRRDQRALEERRDTG